MPPRRGRAWPEAGTPAAPQPLAHERGGGPTDGDGGSGFEGAKSISTSGRVRDGPVGSMASGYSVIKADSLDAALAIAKRCPVLKSGAQISVYDPAPTMGM